MQQHTDTSLGFSDLLPRQAGCVDAERWYEYVHGQLSRETHEALTAHLEECPRCRILLEQESPGASLAPPVYVAPPTAVGAHQPPLRPVRHRFQAVGRWAALAACLALGFGLGVGSPIGRPGAGPVRGGGDGGNQPPALGGNDALSYLEFLLDTSGAQQGSVATLLEGYLARHPEDVAMRMKLVEVLIEERAATADPARRSQLDQRLTAERATLAAQMPELATPAP